MKCTFNFKSTGLTSDLKLNTGFIMNEDDCVRDRLAGGPGLQVDLCRCGCVHVTIGAVTLRLQPDGVLDLARVRGSARAELERRGAASVRPRAPSRLVS